MQDKETITTLIQPKPYLNRVATGFADSLHLKYCLNHSLQRKVNLISALAGYGKRTPVRTLAKQAGMV
jgi:hypothetical protein